MSKIIKTFVNKCLSLAYMGHEWCSDLVSGIVEAGRTISYVETAVPSKADKFHQSIKSSDKRIFMHEFENSVRKILSRLKPKRVKIGFDTTEEVTWCREIPFNLRPSIYNLPLEGWHFLNVSIIEPYYLPLMSVPYRRVDNLDNLVIDLLQYIKTLPITVELILFDRGFYHAYLIDYLNGKKRGWAWPYLILVPKREAQKKYIQRTREDEKIFAYYEHIFDYKKDKSSWNPKTTIMVRIVDEDVAWCYATNQKPSIRLCSQYPKRWGLETGFRVHDEARIKSKSRSSLIRFFNHLIGMLLVGVWRLKQAEAQRVIVFKRYLKFVEYYFCSEEMKSVVPPPGL